MKKLQVKVLIKDSGSLVADLTTMAKQVIPQWFSQNAKALTIFNLILSVISVVEKYSSEVGTLSTNDKIDLCFQLLPIAINLLQSTGAITADKAATFNSYAQDVALVKGFIQVAEDIASNPEIMVLKGEIESEVSGCFAKCSKKK